MKKRFTALLLVALMLSAAVCACASKEEDAARENLPEKTKVVLNEVAHSIFYAPMYVAIEEGYFQEEGIDLELVTGFGADKTMTAVLSDSADIGFMGSEASIYTYNEGATDHVVNFAQLTQRAGNFLVARQEMPDFTWEDLKGTDVLGGRKGGMPQMVFEYILKQNGIDPAKDVAIDQSIDFGSTAAAFAEGQADFTVEFEPGATSLEQEGKGYVVASLGTDSGYVPYTAFSAKQSYLDENPDVIQGFTNALQKGMDFVLDKPENSVYAHVNEEAFTKIISNLLGNGLKYAATFLHVRLTEDKARQTFSIRTENDGTPVPTSLREKIFQPFVRYDGKMTDGTGIGLALARSLAELHRGTLTDGMNITLAKRDGSFVKTKIKELQTFEGLGRKKTEAVSSGDICAIIGIDDFEIGDTVCDYDNPEPLPTIAIDEPTMSMLFTINDSPFFGRDGKYVTSRHINDRLEKELEKNLALRVKKCEDTDKWIVYGRGVLHLSVLIETMRREGYELQIGQPQVIYKEIDGVKCEPIEELTISVPEEYASKMIDMVTRRKGEMKSMETQGDRINLEFDVPSRGIIGLRTNVLTASAGEAIMAHRYKEYQPYKGDIERRVNGSMIAMESGTAFAYAIDKLQDRGRFFIFPQEEVYAGQVVGEHVHENDLVINVTKSKKLTNMRASGSDEKARIIPPVRFSLEEALEYIKEDEYVEVTPKAMRMRKIILNELERKRANKNL